jgi:hypothetical protein
MARQKHTSARGHAYPYPSPAGSGYPTSAWRFTQALGRLSS